MRILLTGLALLGAVLFLGSCSEGELTATNGLKYKLLKAGEGEFAKNGEYLLVNMEYKDENDSVWLSSEKNGSPIALLKDSTWENSFGSINSIFAVLNKVTVFNSRYRVQICSSILLSRLFRHKWIVQPP